MDGDSKRPDGRYLLCEVRNGVWRPLWPHFHPNRRMAGSGRVIAEALRRRNSPYFINALYVEFARTGGAVSAPEFSNTEGLEYFDSLLAVPNRDYLRIPIDREPALSVAAGYEEVFDEAAGEGNLLYITAQTQGMTGVHGVEWTDDSRVYGVSVVSAPVWSDRTRDVVFARSYFDADMQMYKPAGGQLGIPYFLAFEV